MDVKPGCAADLFKLWINWWQGAWLHPILAGVTKPLRHHPVVQGVQSHCHLFEAFSGMEQKEKGLKKNMLKLSKQTPSTPIGQHQGWGDKAQCWICSWCKPNTNRVKRRKSGRTCNPLSYNVNSKLGIGIRG